MHLSVNLILMIAQELLIGITIFLHQILTNHNKFTEIGVLSGLACLNIQLSKITQF